MELTGEARPLKVYLAVGLLQGLALWAASEAWPHAAGWRILCSALLAFTVIGGWQVQLLWGGLCEAGRWRRCLRLPRCRPCWRAVSRCSSSSRAGITWVNPSAPCCSGAT